jgi:hypothetical protein
LKILDSYIFNGSQDSSIVTKGVQIHKDTLPIVACYNMDDKKVELRNENLISSLPVADVIKDLCPLYPTNSEICTQLAALTENKCHVLDLFS